MPIPVSCPCGFSTEVPDAYAGKRGRCKRCGSPIDIPAAAAAAAYAVAEPAAPPRIVTDPVPASGFVATIIDTGEGDVVSPRVEVPAMGREPWYYKFLVIYAHLIILIGSFFGVGLIMIALAASFASSPPPDPAEIGRFTFAAPKPSGPVLLMGLVPGIGLIFGSCVIGAPILLGVDAARNLRVIRLQGHLRAA